MLNEITFSNAWEFFPCTVDGNSLSVRFDVSVMGLDDAMKSTYPHTLIIFIKAVNFDFEFLNKIEDGFARGPFNIRQIGAITGGEGIRYVFCLDDAAAADVDGVVRALLGENQPNLNYECNFIENNNFEYFYNVLMPNIYEQQWISNRHVCANLENAGEAYKEARDIDFYCYFQTEQNIQNVAEKLEQQGFKKITQEKTEQGDYMLHLIMHDIPEFGRINHLTSEILDALQGTDGQFDGWGSPIHK